MDEYDVMKDVKKAIGHKIFWCRIENLAGSGVPDVFSVIDGTMNWIEFKYGRQIPAMLLTPVFKNLNRGLETEQENWIFDCVRRGGRAWIFARIVDYYVMVPGNLAFDFNGLTLAELDQFRITLDRVRSVLAEAPCGAQKPIEAGH